MPWHDTKIQIEDVCEIAFVEPKRFYETSAQYSIIMAGLLRATHCLPSTIIFPVYAKKCENKDYLGYKYKIYNPQQFREFSLFPITTLSHFLRTVIIKKQLQH